LILDTICAGVTYAKYDFTEPTIYTLTGYTIYDTNQTVNQYGCDSTTMLTLWVRPVDSILIIDSICAGNDYTLNGFNIKTIATYEGYVIYDTNKTVNIEGCDSTTMLTLYVNPIPEVSLGEDIAVCHDSIFPVVLDPGEGYSSYLWNVGASSQILSVMQQGTYYVRVENQHHCFNSDTIEIFDLTDLYVRIESLYDFCEKRMTILVANTMASEVVWNTGETSTDIEVNKFGIYSVVASEKGCHVSDFYIIDSCEFRLFIPNAITPTDNNNLNDCFELVLPENHGITSFEINIFDRWGNRVFTSKDLYFKWCGTTVNGSIAHDNTFNYTIKFEENGNKHVIKGTVIVL